MSLIKKYLYDTQEEEQGLYETYLDWLQETPELWKYLPYNIELDLKERGE